MGVIQTIAHSRRYPCSYNSWNTGSFCLFMERFCSPRIVHSVTNINICCLFSKSQACKGLLRGINILQASKDLKPLVQLSIKHVIVPPQQILLPARLCICHPFGKVQLHEPLNPHLRETKKKHSQNMVYFFSLKHNDPFIMYSGQSLKLLKSSINFCKSPVLSLQQNFATDINARP